MNERLKKKSVRIREYDSCIFMYLPYPPCFSLVSEGNETHVMMTETKHVDVRLCGCMCACHFLPLPLEKLCFCRLQENPWSGRYLVAKRLYLLTTLTQCQKVITGENHYGWVRAPSRSSAEVLVCLSKSIFMCLTTSASQLEVKTSFDAEEF